MKAVTNILCISRSDAKTFQCYNVDKNQAFNLRVQISESATVLDLLRTFDSLEIVRESDDISDSEISSGKLCMYFL